MFSIAATTGVLTQVINSPFNAGSAPSWCSILIIYLFTWAVRWREPLLHSRSQHHRGYRQHIAISSNSCVACLHVGFEIINVALRKMVNFGLIGFGLHAAKRPTTGFAAAKNCRVTALSRRELGKAQESARKYEIPLAFDSAEGLCRSPQVDAVFVATPNACHLQDVLIAAACGKPILCEKPMGISANQCQQMVEAARKAKVLLGVAQVFRFEDSLVVSRTTGGWSHRKNDFRALRIFISR